MVKVRKALIRHVRIKKKKMCIYVLVMSFLTTKIGLVSSSLCTICKKNVNLLDIFFIKCEFSDKYSNFQTNINIYMNFSVSYLVCNSSIFHWDPRQTMQRL